MSEKILILDFGSQYTQLIARRIRELNVYSEIVPYNKIPELDDSIKGVILSGSPFSVTDEMALRTNLELAAPPGTPRPEGIAAYGPFRVLGRTRAALVDVTDARSPAAFAAMMRAFPQIVLLEMVECPGTEDDRANLRLGRMIRAAGIATWVPAGGSVRSGGVELFLAGSRRLADPAAEFAVHAWADVDGREAGDYAANAPENAKYLAYYRQMGMSDAEARAFYAMTNSVPNDDALWLTGSDMARWLRLDTSNG